LAVQRKLYTSCETTDTLGTLLPISLKWLECSTKKCGTRSKSLSLSPKQLTVPPQNGKSFSSSSIVFENNYAMNPDVVEMPTKDLTVEMWAKTPAYDSNALGHNPVADLLTYATHIPEAESICELQPPPPRPAPSTPRHSTAFHLFPFSCQTPASRTAQICVTAFPRLIILSV